MSSSSLETLSFLVPGTVSLFTAPPSCLSIANCLREFEAFIAQDQHTSNLDILTPSIVPPSQSSHHDTDTINTTPNHHHLDNYQRLVTIVSQFNYLHMANLLHPHRVDVINTVRNGIDNDSMRARVQVIDSDTIETTFLTLESLFNQPTMNRLINTESLIAFVQRIKEFYYMVTLSLGEAEGEITTEPISDEPPLHHQSPLYQQKMSSLAHQKLYLDELESYSTRFTPQQVISEMKTTINLITTAHASIFSLFLSTSPLSALSVHFLISALLGVRLPNGAVEIGGRSGGVLNNNTGLPATNPLTIPPHLTTLLSQIPHLVNHLYKTFAIYLASPLSDDYCLGGRVGPVAAKNSTSGGGGVGSTPTTPPKRLWSEIELYAPDFTQLKATAVAIIEEVDLVNFPLLLRNYFERVLDSDGTLALMNCPGSQSATSALLHTSTRASSHPELELFINQRKRSAELESSSIVTRDGYTELNSIWEGCNNSLLLRNWGEDNTTPPQPTHHPHLQQPLSPFPNPITSAQISYHLRSLSFALIIDSLIDSGLATPATLETNHLALFPSLTTTSPTHQPDDNFTHSARVVNNIITTRANNVSAAIPEIISSYSRLTALVEELSSNQLTLQPTGPIQMGITTGMVPQALSCELIPNPYYVTHLHHQTSQSKPKLAFETTIQSPTGAPIITSKTVSFVVVGESSQMTIEGVENTDSHEDNTESTTKAASKTTTNPSQPEDTKLAAINTSHLHHKDDVQQYQGPMLNRWAGVALDHRFDHLPVAMPLAPNDSENFLSILAAQGQNAGFKLTTSQLGTKAVAKSLQIQLETPLHRPQAPSTSTKPAQILSKKAGDAGKVVLTDVMMPVGPKSPNLDKSNSTKGNPATFNFTLTSSQNSHDLALTQYIRTMFQLSPLTAPLLAIVQHWAESRRIASDIVNTPSGERLLNPISLTLMVIFYLQTLGELPTLHRNVPPNPHIVNKKELGSGGLVVTHQSSASQLPASTGHLESTFPNLFSPSPSSFSTAKPVPPAPNQWVGDKQLIGPIALIPEGRIQLPLIPLDQINTFAKTNRDTLYAHQFYYCTDSNRVVQTTCVGSANIIDFIKYMSCIETHPAQSISDKPYRQFILDPTPSSSDLLWRFSLIGADELDSCGGWEKEDARSVVDDPEQVAPNNLLGSDQQVITTKSHPQVKLPPLTNELLLHSELQRELAGTDRIPSRFAIQPLSTTITTSPDDHTTALHQHKSQTTAPSIQSLLTHLGQFFYFFGFVFNPAFHAVSTRRGHLTWAHEYIYFQTKFKLNSTGHSIPHKHQQLNFIIEHPFDPLHNVSDGITQPFRQLIQLEFQRAAVVTAHHIKSPHKVPIETVFNPLYSEMVGLYQMYQHAFDFNVIDGNNVTVSDSKQILNQIAQIPFGSFFLSGAQSAQKTLQSSPTALKSKLFSSLLFHAVPQWVQYSLAGVVCTLYPQRRFVSSSSSSLSSSTRLQTTAPNLNLYYSHFIPLLNNTAPLQYCSAYLSGQFCQGQFDGSCGHIHDEFARLAKNLPHMMEILSRVETATNQLNSAPSVVEWKKSTILLNKALDDLSKTGAYQFIPTPQLFTTYRPDSDNFKSVLERSSELDTAWKHLPVDLGNLYSGWINLPATAPSASSTAVGSTEGHAGHFELNHSTLSTSTPTIIELKASYPILSTPHGQNLTTVFFSQLCNAIGDFDRVVGTFTHNGTTTDPDSVNIKTMVTASSLQIILDNLIELFMNRYSTLVSDDDLPPLCLPYIFSPSKLFTPTHNCDQDHSIGDDSHQPKTPQCGNYLHDVELQLVYNTIRLVHLRLQLVFFNYYFLSSAFLRPVVPPYLMTIACNLGQFKHLDPPQSLESRNVRKTTVVSWEDELEADLSSNTPTPSPQPDPISPRQQFRPIALTNLLTWAALHISQSNYNAHNAPLSALLFQPQIVTETRINNPIKVSSQPPLSAAPSSSPYPSTSLSTTPPLGSKGLFSFLDLIRNPSLLDFRHTKSRFETLIAQFKSILAVSLPVETISQCQGFLNGDCTRCSLKHRGYGPFYHLYELMNKFGEYLGVIRNDGISQASMLSHTSSMRWATTHKDSFVSRYSQMAKQGDGLQKTHEIDLLVQQIQIDMTKFNQSHDEFQLGGDCLIQEHRFFALVREYQSFNALATELLSTHWLLFSHNYHPKSLVSQSLGCDSTINQDKKEEDGPETKCTVAVPLNNRFDNLLNRRYPNTNPDGTPAHPLPQHQTLSAINFAASKLALEFDLTILNHNKTLVMMPKKQRQASTLCMGFIKTTCSSNMSTMGSMPSLCTNSHNTELRDLWQVIVSLRSQADLIRTTLLTIPLCSETYAISEYDIIQFISTLPLPLLRLTTQLMTLDGWSLVWKKVLPLLSPHPSALTRTEMLSLQADSGHGTKFRTVTLSMLWPVLITMYSKLTPEIPVIADPTTPSDTNQSMQSPTSTTLAATSNYIQFRSDLLPDAAFLDTPTPKPSFDTIKALSPDLKHPDTSQYTYLATNPRRFLSYFPSWLDDFGDYNWFFILSHFVKKINKAKHATKYITDYVFEQDSRTDDPLLHWKCTQTAIVDGKNYIGIGCGTQPHKVAVKQLTSFLILLHLTPSFLIPIASFYGVKYQYLSMTPRSGGCSDDQGVQKSGDADNTTRYTVVGNIDSAPNPTLTPSDPKQSQSDSNQLINTEQSNENDVASPGEEAKVIKKRVVKKVVKKATSASLTSPTATLDDLADAFGF